MGHLALGNFILVEAADNEKVSKGGRILECKAQADVKRSRIVSISEQLLQKFSENKHKRNLEVGDIIYHAYHIGTPMTTHDEKSLTALHIDNVLSVEIES